VEIIDIGKKYYRNFPYKIDKNRRFWLGKCKKKDEEDFKTDSKLTLHSLFFALQFFEFALHSLFSEFRFG
jgi:hypothetical protein